MRLRHKKNAETDILNSPIVINIGKTQLYDLDANANVNQKMLCEPDKIFGNNNEVHLELGMGKGRFITLLSRKNANINYIGIERSATIILKAIDALKNKNFQDKKEDSEISFTESSLISLYPNLRFMCLDIAKLDQVFKPHSIDKIYLNFSDPWPKKRHEIRRLTHKNFLSIYEKILKGNSTIEFKTDNIDLFNFSLEEVKNSNFKLLEYTYDLHNDFKMNEGNIMTEYEEKFSKLGNKICKMIIKVI